MALSLEKSCQPQTERHFQIVITVPRKQDSVDWEGRDGAARDAVVREDSEGGVILAETWRMRKSH